MLGHTELCCYILSTSNSHAIINFQEENKQIIVFTYQGPDKKKCSTYYTKGLLNFES